MKKLIYIFLFISRISLLEAQSGTITPMPIQDTLSYVKQFETNKSEYINKPFSYLLSHMQIQPKSHWTSTNIKNKNIVKSSRFKFCGIDYSFKNAVTLHVIWQDTFPNSEVKYYQNKNGYLFTNEETLFYGNKIVKDILVYK